jgi:hypothetical protein
MRSEEFFALSKAEYEKLSDSPLFEKISRSEILASYS